MNKTNRHHVKERIIEMAAYFNFKLSAETLDVYGRYLQDIEPETFDLAVDRLYQNSEWMPKIPHFRKAVMDNIMQKAGIPSPAQAWGEVSRHLSSDHQENIGTLQSVNRLEDHQWSHPIVKEAVEQIGWHDLYWIYRSGDASGMMSNRARFMDAYRDLVSKLKEHYSLTPDLRAAIEPLEQPQLPTPEPESLSDNDRPEFGHNYWAEMPEKAKKKLDDLRGKMEVTNAAEN
ncbi:MAG: hypothetical protein SVT56_03775 [Chloroflexota bacterium]|nr:hypothetical protein [Chloroflexota bacterium]